jgi:hypothetical protein
MGHLINYCAGTSVEVLPGKHIDALLLNVPNNAEDDRKIRASRNLIKVAQPKTVMLDSGGFQLLNAQDGGLQIIYDESAPIHLPGTINLTPWHLIRGAVKIQPDSIVGLDFPIRKILERERQEVEFRYKLGFNLTWAIKSAELRQIHCPGIRLFLPVQCYSLEHLDLFVKLIGNVPFDGFSMPVRNLSLGQIAMFLLRFYQLGVRQVHLLGTLSFFTIALSAYAARHFFDWVSLDATSWRKKAEYQNYANPYDLSSEFIGPDVQIDGNIKVVCPCPWCQGKTFTDIKDLPYTEKTDFLRCHNHWVTEKVCRELYQSAQTLSGLRSYLMAVSSHPEKVDILIRILGSLDVCKGLEPSVARDFLMAAI